MEPSARTSKRSCCPGTRTYKNSIPSALWLWLCMWLWMCMCSCVVLSHMCCASARDCGCVCGRACAGGCAFVCACVFFQRVSMASSSVARSAPRAVQPSTPSKRTRRGGSANRKQAKRPQGMLAARAHKAKRQPTDVDTQTAGRDRASAQRGRSNNQADPTSKTVPDLAANVRSIDVGTCTACIRGWQTQG